MKSESTNYVNDNWWLTRKEPIRGLKTKLSHPRRFELWDWTLTRQQTVFAVAPDRSLLFHAFMSISLHQLTGEREMENVHLAMEEDDIYSGYNDYNPTFDSEVSYVLS